MKEIKKYTVLFMVTLFALSTLMIVSAAEAGFTIRIEKDLPMSQVLPLPTVLTINIWDNNTSTVVATQDYLTGAWEADYDFSHYAAGPQNVVRFMMDFSNTDTLTADMDLLVEMKFDGVTKGPIEHLKQEARSLFSEEAAFAGDADTLDGQHAADLGDIQGVTAGTGLTGGGTSGTVAVSADTTYLQRRVSSTCTAGSSIRAIASDGTVTCETDDNSGGDITGVTAGTGITGGGTSGTVTVNADTTYLQRRVSSSCMAGSSIRAIASDGTVTCESDDAGDADWTVSGSNMYSAVSGDVGIGTTSPLYKLDVRDGTSNYLGYFNNDNNASGNAFGVYVEGDAYGTSTGYGYGGTFYAYGGSTSGNAYGTLHYAYAYGSSNAYGVYSDADNGSTTGREYAFYGYGDGYFSGNLGIGTNSPSYKLEILDGSSTYLGYFNNDNNSSGNSFGIYAEGDANGTGTGYGYGGTFYAYGGSTGGGAYGTRNYAYAYGSSNSYGVYSDANNGSTTGREYAFYGDGDGYFSGNVGIGTTTPDYQLEVLDSQTSSPVARFENTSTGTNADGIAIELGPTSNPGSVNDYLQFFDGDGSFVGWVSGNGSGGVNYNTASDARLKTKIADFAGGLDMVSRIKVRKYEFIEAPGKEMIGFLAQELQTVFPQAVSETTAYEEKPMGVDYGSVTPVLVSAIQELKAENEALKAELEEIKAALGL